VAKVLAKTLDDAVAAASKEHVSRKVALTKKGLQVGGSHLIHLI
jgi:hypothetical protein